MGEQSVVVIVVIFLFFFLSLQPVPAASPCHHRIVQLAGEEVVVRCRCTAGVTGRMVLAAHVGRCPTEGGGIPRKGGSSSNNRTRSDNDERQVQVGRGNGETGFPHVSGLQQRFVVLELTVSDQGGPNKQFDCLGDVRALVDIRHKLVSDLVPVINLI